MIMPCVIKHMRDQNRVRVFRLVQVAMFIRKGAI